MKLFSITPIFTHTIRDDNCTEIFTAVVDCTTHQQSIGHIAPDYLQRVSLLATMILQYTHDFILVHLASIRCYCSLLALWPQKIVKGKNASIVELQLPDLVPQKYCHMIYLYYIVVSKLI